MAPFDIAGNASLSLSRIWTALKHNPQRASESFWAGSRHRAEQAPGGAGTELGPTYAKGTTPSGKVVPLAPMDGRYPARALRSAATCSAPPQHPGADVL
jgi:hypothetical protein